MAGKPNKWRAIGGSVRGAAHIRAGKPCQDAVKILCGAQEPFLAAAVADGHGSDDCPFSDKGAFLAVEIACGVFAELFRGRTQAEALRAITANKDIWLPKQMEMRWKEAVSQQGTKVCASDLYQLYGTTLLALLVSDDFIFALQIGDGDIILIEEDKARWVFPPEAGIGVETDSLCQKDCWQRIKTRTLQANASSMFLLSTDGYLNSFTESKGFLEAASDICRLLREEGSEYVESCLENWMSESSENGSGDDISVVLVY